MVGCLTLTLLVGCSAAEKPVEQVKQVKNTITAETSYRGKNGRNRWSNHLL